MNHNTEPSPWRTTREAAIYGRRSQRHVWRAIDSGALPATRVGERTRWLIHRDALMAWAAAGCPVDYDALDNSADGQVAS